MRSKKQKEDNFAFATTHIVRLFRFGQNKLRKEENLFKNSYNSEWFTSSFFPFSFIPFYSFLIRLFKSIFLLFCSQIENARNKKIKKSSKECVNRNSNICTLIQKQQLCINSRKKQSKKSLLTKSNWSEYIKLEIECNKHLTSF